jgi:hypothetical protein
LEPNLPAHTGWFSGGCGTAILAAAFPELRIGFVGVSLEFGLPQLWLFCVAALIGAGIGALIQKRVRPPDDGLENIGGHD